MSRRYFRVVIPTNADKLLSLANSILQKHQQDGGDSPISTSIASALQAQYDIAGTEHSRRNELDRQKENLNEARNLLLGVHPSQNAYTEGTVLYFVTAARDVLLGYFRGSERQLGDWGYTVNSPKGQAQIIISRKPDELIALAKAVMQKHQTDGKDSLLNSLDWDTFTKVLAEAEAKLEAARQANRDKEKATQVRNRALGIDRGQTSKTPNTVKYLVRSIRDLLLGICRGREQELGDWGFEVNFSKGSDQNVVDEEMD